MDVSECESRTEEETMELQHFSHPHPLVFFKYQTVASKEVDPEAARCFGCENPLEGGSYGCNQCKFYLHKGCAELELVPRIQHPFHPQHPLTFFPQSPYLGEYVCGLCGGIFWGFVYHCGSCLFDLHINCALLESSIATNFPNSLHHHPLHFIQNHNEEVERDCSGCQTPLSGPIYHCFDCSYPTFFTLHKKCVEEQPLEINHSCDRKHPLTLLPQRPAHPEKCNCYLCKIQWNGFVYSCSLCNFELSVDDIVSPPTITNASHEHPWMLISKKMSFICDFCGIVGDHSPYLCATCNLVVHKNCISLPRNIRITQHCHVICFSYSFQQNQVEDCMCKICQTEVDTSYGRYCCSASGCDYIAHAHCATNKSIWDGTIIKEGYDEKHGPSNLITDVFEQISIEEIMVASKIKHSYHHHNLRLKHSYHHHNLRLTFSGEIKDDSQCDGCMRPISNPFYSCEQCKFFLHKNCAELSKEMGHPFHKHALTLTNSRTLIEYSICNACSHWYQGFSYRCYRRGCSLNFDIRCMLMLNTLNHPSHDHSLFLEHNRKRDCSACSGTMEPWSVAYRCMKRCDYTLDVGCSTLPLTAWYKYDKHPLTLTYSDESEPSQLYCDLCEKERQPNSWFYYCADCDNSLHLNCALGDLPYMKLGNKIKGTPHRHPLTVVKNIWNCPPCVECRELCNGQALECKETGCNFTVHWDCCWGLTF